MITRLGSFTPLFLVKGIWVLTWAKDEILAIQPLLQTFGNSNQLVIFVPEGAIADKLWQMQVPESSRPQLYQIFLVLPDLFFSNLCNASI